MDCFYSPAIFGPGIPASGLRYRRYTATDATYRQPTVATRSTGLRVNHNSISLTAESTVVLSSVKDIINVVAWVAELSEFKMK
jgi:hypothetical protein